MAYKIGNLCQHNGSRSFCNFAHAKLLLSLSNGLSYIFLYPRCRLQLSWLVFWVFFCYVLLVISPALSCFLLFSRGCTFCFSTSPFHCEFGYCSRLCILDCLLGCTLAFRYTMRRWYSCFCTQLLSLLLFLT